MHMKYTLLVKSGPLDLIFDGDFVRIQLVLDPCIDSGMSLSYSYGALLQHQHSRGGDILYACGWRTAISITSPTNQNFA